MSRRDRQIAERAASWEANNRDATDPNLSPAERRLAAQEARADEQQIRSLFGLPLRTN